MIKVKRQIKKNFIIYIYLLLLFILSSCGDSVDSSFQPDDQIDPNSSTEVDNSTTQDNTKVSNETSDLKTSLEASKAFSPMLEHSKDETNSNHKQSFSTIGEFVDLVHSLEKNPESLDQELLNKDFDIDTLVDNHWNKINSFYQAHPHITTSAETLIDTANSLYKKHYSLNLLSSNPSELKFETPSSQNETTSLSTKTITPKIFSSWMNFVYCLYYYNQFFPQKRSSINIGGTSYKTVTFSNIPTSFVLVFMRLFYFSDDNYQPVAKVESKLLPDFSNPTLYETLSFILTDLYKLRSHMSSSSLEQEIIQNQRINDLQARVQKNYQDKIINIKNSHIDKIQDISKFVKEKSNGKIIIHVPTKEKTDHFGSLHANFPERVLLTELETHTSIDVDELLGTIYNRDLSEYSQYIENFTHQTGSINPHMLIYTAENSLYHTSITIIEDNLIPINMKIESLYQSKYSPILRVSLTP